MNARTWLGVACQIGVEGEFELLVMLCFTAIRGRWAARSTRRNFIRLHRQNP
jgi:hypothetical protein